jgi:hypothetical protein
MDWRFEAATVVAAFVSALVSLFVARWTAARAFESELAKLHLSTQANIFGRLLDARLAIYPDLYALLSHLIKVRLRGPIDVTSLRNLIRAVDEWDSKHAILFGPRTTNDCYFFRDALQQLLAAADDPAHSQDLGRRKKDVLNLASRLELALRADLGIYGIDAFQGRGMLRTPAVVDYVEAEQLDVHTTPAKRAPRSWLKVTRSRG